MKQLVIGSPLHSDQMEIGELATKAVNGTLKATSRVTEPGGDIRYWGVEPSQSIVLQRLEQYAVAHYREATGRAPGSHLIMVNHINASSSPNGSGDGWHRDSLQAQYKAIAYLTDVDNDRQGAFCFLPGTNTVIARAFSAVHRVATGGNRYSDRTIDRLVSLGCTKEVLLLKAGVPFFANTSIIHRGLPITEGFRVAATVYMFAGPLPGVFQKLVTPSAN